jgi:hypothetical protein
MYIQKYWKRRVIYKDVAAVIHTYLMNQWTPRGRKEERFYLILNSEFDI